MVAAADVAAQSGPALRALVVTIVGQDDFLLTLLAGADGTAPLLQVSTAHVRDLRERLAAETFDLVIAHDHARPAQRLASQGVLSDGRIVFANAQTVIGPQADPAGLAGATSLDDAVRRLHASKSCWLYNRHAGLRELQDLVLGEYLDGLCTIDDASHVGVAAVQAAQQHGAYTLWGFHPFTRLGLSDMRAFSFDERRLLRPLRVWIVAAGPHQAAAQDLVRRLLSDQIQQRIAPFRLHRDALNQAFWPAHVLTDRAGSK